MLKSLSTKFFDSPASHILLGLALGWIGTAGASQVARDRLFWIGLGLIAVVAPLELWVRAFKRTGSAGTAAAR